MSRTYLMIVCLITVTMVIGQAGYVEEQERAKTTYLLMSDVSYRNRKTEKNWTDYMDEQCRLDIYYPENQAGFPTVVWFHAGNLMRGNRYIPDRLKEQEIAVVAVSYRLHPKVSSPAYIEDAAGAIAWVFKNIENIGGDASLIFVSGHSAGGYLTIMTGLNIAYLARYGVDANDIAGLIPFSCQTVTHSTIRAERGIPQIQVTVDELAPLYHVRADSPPLVLITGDRELEIWGRYEENAYMARMMKLAGHNHTRLHELDGFDLGRLNPINFSDRFPGLPQIQNTHLPG